MGRFSRHFPRPTLFCNCSSILKQDVNIPHEPKGGRKLSVGRLDYRKARYKKRENFSLVLRVDANRRNAILRCTDV